MGWKNPPEPGEEGFPFSVPAIRSLRALKLKTPVTFFVGENGRGKSTLLEGSAAVADVPTLGSEAASGGYLACYSPLARGELPEYLPRAGRGGAGATCWTIPRRRSPRNGSSPSWPMRCGRGANSSSPHTPPSCWRIGALPSTASITPRCSRCGTRS